MTEGEAHRFLRLDLREEYDADLDDEHTVEQRDALHAEEGPLLPPD